MITFIKINACYALEAVLKDLSFIVYLLHYLFLQLPQACCKTMAKINLHKQCLL